MDEQLQTEFRAKLESLRREIHMRARASLRDVEVPSSDDRPDSMDLATSVTNQTLTRTFQDRDRAILLEIEAALRRLEDGEYGICEDCDEEIGLGRLRAQPTTTLCVRCKEEQEQMGGKLEDDDIEWRAV